MAFQFVHPNKLDLSVKKENFVLLERSSLLDLCDRNCHFVSITFIEMKTTPILFQILFRFVLKTAQNYTCIEILQHPDLTSNRQGSLAWVS